MRVIQSIICILAVVATTSILADRPKLHLNAILGQSVVLSINGQHQMIKLYGRTSTGHRLTHIGRDHAVFSDGNQNYRIKIGSGIGNYRTQQASKVTIPNSNGMYFVNGLVNQQGVKFLVDTGATSIAMNSDTAERLGIDYRNAGSKGKAFTAAGEVNTWDLHLATVTVGDITLHNVDAAIIEGQHPQVALLGMSFLNQTRMVNNGTLMTLERVK